MSCTPVPIYGLAVPFFVVVVFGFVFLGFSFGGAIRIYFVFCFWTSYVACRERK